MSNNQRHHCKHAKIDIGALCGSSYLNEGFERLLTERLAGEDYLETNNLTLKGIVDMQVVDFENKMKRSVDVTSRNREPERVWIQGLRPNNQKRFKANRLMLSWYVHAFRNARDMGGKCADLYLVRILTAYSCHA